HLAGGGRGGRVARPAPGTRADPVHRHAGLRRQPGADPAPERLRPRPRRDRRLAGRPRPGADARRRLAAGPLRAARPDRPRRPRARERNPARGTRRGAVRAAGPAGRARRGGPPRPQDGRRILLLRGLNIRPRKVLTFRLAKAYFTWRYF